MHYVDMSGKTYPGCRIHCTVLAIGLIALVDDIRVEEAAWIARTRAGLRGACTDNQHAMPKRSS